MSNRVSVTGLVVAVTKLSSTFPFRGFRSIYVWDRSAGNLGCLLEAQRVKAGARQNMRKQEQVTFSIIRRNGCWCAGGAGTRTCAYTRHPHGSHQNSPHLRACGSLRLSSSDRSMRLRLPKKAKRMRRSEQARSKKGGA
eukprot:355058-Chlamydomonas_euryale.AAC.2